MPVVESPSWDSWPAPAPGNRPKGNFALMKIDPIASVAIFEDEETTRAAAALERHEWVLGLITGLPPGLPDADGKESMSLRLELIGQGPPKDKPIASLPFAPSPQLYDDRPPIELHPRLPWSDLYLHTKFSSSVLISRIHHGPGYFQVMLNENEYDPIAGRAFDDRVNWKKLPPVTEEEGPAIPTLEMAGSFPPTRSFHPSDSSADGSSSEDKESLYAQQREDMGMKLLKARIYAEISLDPATCPGPLGCPPDLVEPVARIRELWTCWQERMTTEMLAKRPATNAWIQAVEAARYGSESEIDNPDNVDVPLDDTAIVPEDAVDDCIGRAGSGDQHDPLSTPAPTGVDVSGSDLPNEPATPHSSGKPATSPTPSSPGDGAAGLGISTLATQVPGTDSGDPAAGNAQLRPTVPLQAPVTAANPTPRSSAQMRQVSILKRILLFSRRVKPTVVRAKASLKHMMGQATGQKPHAGT